MSQKNIELILQRISSLEVGFKELAERTEAHLLEGSGVKTDLLWLKRALWAVAGGMLTFSFSLVLYVLTH